MEKVKAKYGDRITYKDYSGNIITTILGKGFDGFDLVDLNIHLGSVLSIERPNYQEIYNCEILDKTEKKYLSSVIRPFNNKVIYIKKVRSYFNDDKEFIHISLSGEYMCFPYFTAGTMYKGMEENKKYTLEELGL